LTASVFSTADLINSGLLEIGDGYRAKNSELADRGIPFARAQNVNSGFDFADADLFPEDALPRVGAKISRPGDCVLTSKGSVGRVGFVGPRTPRFVYSPQLSYWRSLAPKEIDPLYLRYWLQGPEFGVQRDAVKGSTDMADYVNLRDQRRMTITLPDAGLQRKIAAILSAYDDLIENNERRIKLLEEMAQRIYREWFVDFRYPGHEDIPLVGSELGPIPEGWRISELQDVAQAARGLSWDREQEVDAGGLPIITIPNVQARLQLAGMTRLVGVDPANVAKYSLSHGDTVLVGSNGNPERVGAAVWIPKSVNVLFASFLMRVRSDPGLIGPAVMHMQLKDPRLTSAWRSSAIGSTSLRNIRLTTLKESPVLLPSPSVLSLTEPILRDLLDLQDAWSDASASLRETRDLLLPRLISGEVDVEDLEIVVPDEAAA
jgi:type I restriction enzyme S subunit